MTKGHLLLFLVLFGSSVCGAEVLDRMVAVVDGRIITLSDIRKERAILAAFGEEPGDDNTLLQSLIEKSLIEAQIAQFPNIEVDEQEVAERMRQIPNSSVVSTSDIREAVIAGIRRNEFFNQRFRQFLRTGDDELQKYYDEVFVPEARLRGMNPIPSLEQVRELVRGNLIAEKMDQEQKMWLETIRGRSKVEIFK